MDNKLTPTEPVLPPASEGNAPPAPTAQEIGGAKRATDPARYGDWEINGKCVDF